MRKFFATALMGMSLIAGFTMILGISGCPSNPPAGTPSTTSTSTTSPVFDRAALQRDVFAAKEAYGVAERLAIGYARLARCKVPPVMPCSDQAVVDQILKARNVAHEALAAAQSAVDNPLFGADAASTAVIAGQAGLKAFESIANKTKE